MAFLAKDSILVVDDYVRVGSAYDHQRQQKSADQVLRGQGNRAGRQRLTRDSNFQREMFPRGIVISTGEDTPTGQSLVARMIVVEFEDSSVDNAILTELQAAGSSGLLAEAMAGYIQWILANPSQTDRLNTLQLDYRQRARGTHARTPDNLAQLMVGLATFLRYARYVGAISESEVRAHLRQAWKALLAQAEIQDRHASHDDPIDRFFSLIASALSSGEAHLASAKTGAEPEWPKRCGWRHHFIGAGQNTWDEWRPGGKCIGWIDGDNLFLNHNAAYEMVSERASRSGHAIAINARTVWKRLAERGLLLTAKTGRNLADVTVAGARKQVVHLSATSVLGFAPAAEMKDEDSAF
jgi:hypothetical protein